MQKGSVNITLESVGVALWPGAPLENGEPVSRMVLRIEYPHTTGRLEIELEPPLAGEIPERDAVIAEIRRLYQALGHSLQTPSKILLRPSPHK